MYSFVFLSKSKSYGRCRLTTQVKLCPHPKETLEQSHADFLLDVLEETDDAAESCEPDLSLLTGLLFSEADPVPGLRENKLVLHLLEMTDQN